MKKYKIGMIGLGTVGCGVYKTLQEYKNVEITKIPTKKYVTLFKPFSVDFCEEKSWLAAPIEAIPSPFGECNNTKITLKTALIICNV